MRKKPGRSNHRKIRLSNLWRRGVTREDETDWFLFEADMAAAPVAPRRRRARRSWVVRGLALACLGVSVPLAIDWMNDAVFYENEEFVLQRLDVRTDGSLSEAQLTKVANVSVGMSLMELDLAGIRGRLEKIPNVEEAVISREMPDKLNVRVEERIPVAWVSCPPLGIRPGDMERGYLLDADGYLFRCLDLTDGILSLPVIEAFKIDDPEEGERLETDGVEEALELVQSNGRVFEKEALAVHEVKVRNEWSLQCVYRNGLEVTFGRREIGRGLADLRTILEQTDSAGATLASVNVAARDNIPVTFAEPVDPETISATARPLVTAASSESLSPKEQQEKHLRSILKGG